MQKIILLMMILLSGLFASIIVVDERQNVVIEKYNGKLIVKPYGIYLTLPLIDKVSYVFINQRLSLLTLTLNESNISSNPIQLEVLINYHVVNPGNYFLAVNKYGKLGISEKIASSITKEARNIIQSKSLDDFNQNPVFFINKDDFILLGISVDQINLVNIKYISNDNKQQNNGNKNEATYTNFRS